jgi:hypothetical protein
MSPRYAKTAGQRKLRHDRVSTDRIVEMKIDEIRPSPENNQLYRIVNPSDPEVVALMASVVNKGDRDDIIFKVIAPTILDTVAIAAIANLLLDAADAEVLGEEAKRPSSVVGDPDLPYHVATKAKKS